MGIYGEILTENKKDIDNLITFESYLMEKVQISPPTTKYGNYQTDIQFKGLNIQIRTYSKTSEEQIQQDAEQLEKDFPVFKSNFDKLEKRAFEELFKDCENWNMENVKNPEQLKKMVSLDLIVYHYNKRDQVGNFECWYNNYGKCNEFFGNHTFVIDIGVEKSKEAFTTDSSLEG